MVQGQAGYGRSGQGRVAYGAVQCAVTWRGDSAGEDGCLRGQDPLNPPNPRGQHRSGQVRSGKVRSGLHGCDADQAPPRGTAMDACLQGRPDPLPARGFQREIATENTESEETLASHTYRRSVQEAHAIRGPYALHTPHDNSIR